MASQPAFALGSQPFASHGRSPHASKASRARCGASCSPSPRPRPESSSQDTRYGGADDLGSRLIFRCRRQIGYGTSTARGQPAGNWIFVFEKWERLIAHWTFRPFGAVIVAYRERAAKFWNSGDSKHGRIPVELTKSACCGVCSWALHCMRFLCRVWDDVERKHR